MVERLVAGGGSGRWSFMRDLVTVVRRNLQRVEGEPSEARIMQEKCGGGRW